MPSQDNIQERLKTAQEECQRLREENARLRAMLGIDHSATNESVSQAVLVTKLSSTGTSGVPTPEKKIALFRNLFRGREDVFAIRWEGKSGKSGYSPAGVMDWRAIHASRPEERKKVARKTRMLQPLTDDAIRNHLTGKHTIGVYPLLPDETCWFLAVDFDKKSWVIDAAAFAATCRRFQVPFAIERSRSGNGAHVWIFFDRPVSAADARRLGLEGTELAKAQCCTIRLKLLKIGALMRITVRKVWVSLAGGYPYVTLFRQVYEKLCAVPIKH